MKASTLLRVFTVLATTVSLWYMIYYVYPSPLFPPPHSVVYALTDLVVNEDLLGQLLLSLYRVLLGFSMGILLGLALGILVLLSRLMKNIIYPLIAFIAVTPSFAFVPLLMLWIGLNDLLPIAVVVLCTGFPLAYTIVSGSKKIDPDVIDVALTLGASKKTLLLRIILPLTLTHIASMLKLEASHSWRLVFVTEFLAVSSGLGYLMMKAYSMIRVDKILALIMVLGLSTLLLQHLIERFETLLTSRWGYRRIP